ncbi:CGA synthase-related protein [Streptomyces sp. URMC 126]|uniref:CGA synthase-related protein n=1 Tax=Streptomyces sp. URMC 126 TaxID=3423401 RepID=UPI003F1C4D56
MAVLTPTGGAVSPPRMRVRLVCRERQLDSVLACRRIAAHLGGLTTVTGPPDASGAPGPPADAALVCDDSAATERLLARGVPVLHLYAGHLPAVPPRPAGRALYRLHRPGWLPGPAGTEDGTTDGVPLGAPGVRPTGLLAPARTARNRDRAGTLVLLSLWGVPADEAEAFVRGPLAALARAAAERTGRCEVVSDTALATVRTALAAAAGGGAVRVHRAAAVDADALHAGRAVLLASPTPGALALAQARRAPLALLPPLGAAQRDLAGRVARAVPLPVAHDPGDPALWAPPDHGPWDVLDPAADDLRGAQRVARSVRQLSLAPP